jgi:hypothetical protein
MNITKYPIPDFDKTFPIPATGAQPDALSAPGDPQDKPRRIARACLPSRDIYCVYFRPSTNMIGVIPPPLWTLITGLSELRTTPPV